MDPVETPDPAETPDAPDTTSIEDLQEQLKTWKSHARNWEAKAKANLSAAEQLTALQAELDAKNTELTEKVGELDTLKGSALELEDKLTRSDIVIKYGLSPEDAELLTGDRESMEKLAARIGSNSGPRAPRPDPHQGRGSDPAPINTRDQFAALFEGN